MFSFKHTDSPMARLTVADERNIIFFTRQVENSFSIKHLYRDSFKNKHGDEAIEAQLQAP